MSGAPPDAPDRKAKTGRRIRNATACLDVQTHGNGKLVLADRPGYDIINVEKRMDLPARRWGEDSVGQAEEGAHGAFWNEHGG